jgi:hypothetical protein
VVGLAWSDDPESYAGGSVAIVGPPMPDGSKVMTQSKTDAQILQVGVGLQTPPHKKYVLLRGFYNWKPGVGGRFWKRLRSTKDCNARIIIIIIIIIIY